MFRDRTIARDIIKRLKAMELELRIMHVCGTHQDTIVRYGLDYLLKDCGIEVRQGPGCPVCVTTGLEFEKALRLAREGVIVTAFGDVYRVPSSTGSLASLRGEGFDTRIVYSIEDAVSLAKNTTKEVVFMGVGFETTAPTTASVLINEPPENFSVLSCHRYVPPALKALLEMGMEIDGLIEPGHVSTIIGVEPYEELSSEYNMPQVIAGFEPLDMLIAIYMLALQIQRGEAKVENEYERVVKREGNVKAKKLMAEVFEPVDVRWRGFPSIPSSGMSIKKKFEDWDASKKFEDILGDVADPGEPEGCICGEVLKGIANPRECPLFARVCTPDHPVGPCMVSVEGMCHIEYKYS